MKGLLTPAFQTKVFRPAGHFFYHGEWRFFGFDFKKCLAATHVHPSPVLGGGPSSGLAPAMLFTLFFGMFAMLMLWACILRVRIRVARLERAADDLTRRANELEDLRRY